jgi:hypothetical protein
MSVFTVTLKTHSREDLTEKVNDQLNDCIVHSCKPRIVKMVVGKRKEIYFVANCKHEDCGKIACTLEDAIAFWNKWNPKV